MARRRSSAQTIFFPWERGGGVFGTRGVARAKPFAVALAMAAFMLVLGARERRAAGERSTRATLTLVTEAVDAWRADHERACPPSLAALRAEKYLAVAPVDAWGRPLRLVCPGRANPDAYDLLSDGPDGEIGGLDRVE